MVEKERGEGVLCMVKNVLSQHGISRYSAKTGMTEPELSPSQIAGTRTASTIMVQLSWDN